MLSSQLLIDRRTQFSFFDLIMILFIFSNWVNRIELMMTTGDQNGNGETYGAVKNWKFALPKVKIWTDQCSHLAGWTQIQ